MPRAVSAFPSSTANRNVGFLRPRMPTSATTTTVTTASRSAAPPRAAFTSYYDPSRIVDLDKLKVVSDLRTEGAERGEVQSGDDGSLGPGSSSGAFVAPPQSSPMIAEKKSIAPIALAALAYFLLT